MEQKRLIKLSSSKTISRLMVLFVLCILNDSTYGMDDTSASASSPSQIRTGLSGAGVAGQREPHYAPLIDLRDQFAGNGKRAYTYRSEYKRLPVYTFGIGKRWALIPDNKRAPHYSFGVGKRRHFSFGVGKRSNYEESDDYGYLPNDFYDADAPREALENYLENKRSASNFKFGVGKRDAEDNLHENLPIKNSRDQYLFGLGKRASYYQEIEDDDTSQLLN